MEITADGATLVLQGDLDGRSTWDVRMAIYDHLEHHGHVVLDMSGVELIDLTALKLIAVATRRAAAEGHHLTLRGCTPSVRRMLHLSRMRRMVEVEHAVPA